MIYFQLLTDRFQLGQRRATAPILDIEIEKNICVVLNCLADKFVGYQSTLIFTHNVCNYLCYLCVSINYKIRNEYTHSFMFLLHYMQLES